MVAATADEIVAATRDYRAALAEQETYKRRVALRLWIHGNDFADRECLERAQANLLQSRDRLAKLSGQKPESFRLLPP